MNPSIKGMNDMSVKSYVEGKRPRHRNIFLKKRKKEDGLSKSERLMKGVGTWTSYYRANPHRFVRDYLGINLKLFQQILIFMMMYNNYFMYLASRGQGKTFLTAIYCCVRAILYPESKIVIAAGQKSQSREVIEKIVEIMENSPNLVREIEDHNRGVNDPRVEFHNGSWIKTVTANDGARSRRANVLVVDEFRMVDFDVINTVLRKFLTAARQPRYLNKPEYKNLTERNQELYLSSAWYKHHWSFKRLKAYFSAMMEGRRYFVAGLPYQLSIKEGLLEREQVEDEMAEDDFDRTAFEMEMECLFFGESEKAYFNFEDLASNRKIPRALYPKNKYSVLRDSNFKYEKKKNGELRILTADIAVMSGSQNDASSFSVLRLLPSNNGYERIVSYMESIEGGHTETQAIRIRQLFSDFDCDYLVLDTQTVGMGVYDLLTTALIDRERGVEYEPWTCVNDENMAKRCRFPDAEKVIYSIKANRSMNSSIAISFKDDLRRGKIKLLVPDSEGRDFLRNLKGFDELPEEMKVDLEMPFTQTTLLVNEMINLERERVTGSEIVLKEPRSGRKDRYSSVSYGNYIARELERDYLHSQNESNIDDYMFFMSSGF